MSRSAPSNHRPSVLARSQASVSSAAAAAPKPRMPSVFSVPGLGRLAQEAVAARDTPLLLGIILVSAVLVVLVNLAVDIAYAFLDPRVGTSEART